MIASKHTLVSIWSAQLLLLAALVSSSPAQMLLGPLHVGATTPIVNEFGDVLPGQASAPGCLVMVLWASNNVIYPPDVNGQPDPRNPVVEGGLAGIGKLSRSDLERPGTFGMALNRPADGSRLFIRVFNSTNASSSSFYGDSGLFTVSANVGFDAQIAATTNALDPNDDDLDGLNNSWEESYGSDSGKTDSDDDGIADLAEHQMGLHPGRSDSDGDGMPDGHELRAGTQPDDEASYLGVAQLQPTQLDLVIRWASVTGKFYQVEGSEDALTNPTGFTQLSEIIPADTGSVTFTTLTNAMQDPGMHFYRIRLVEE